MFPQRVNSSRNDSAAAHRHGRDRHQQQQQQQRHGGGAKAPSSSIFDFHDHPVNGQAEIASQYEPLVGSHVSETRNASPGAASPAAAAAVTSAGGRPDTSCSCCPAANRPQSPDQARTIPAITDARLLWNYAEKRTIFQLGPAHQVNDGTRLVLERIGTNMQRPPYISGTNKFMARLRHDYLRIRFCEDYPVALPLEAPAGAPAFHSNKDRAPAAGISQKLITILEARSKSATPYMASWMLHSDPELWAACVHRTGNVVVDAHGLKHARWELEWHGPTPSAIELAAHSMGVQCTADNWRSVFAVAAQRGDVPEGPGDLYQTAEQLQHTGESTPGSARNHRRNRCQSQETEPASAARGGGRRGGSSPVEPPLPTAAALTSRAACPGARRLHFSHTSSNASGEAVPVDAGAAPMPNSSDVSATREAHVPQQGTDASPATAERSRLIEGTQVARTVACVHIDLTLDSESEDESEDDDGDVPSGEIHDSSDAEADSDCTDIEPLYSHTPTDTPTSSKRQTNTSSAAASTASWTRVRSLQAATADDAPTVSPAPQRSSLPVAGCSKHTTPRTRKPKRAREPSSDATPADTPLCEMGFCQCARTRGGQRSPSDARGGSRSSSRSSISSNEE